MSILDITKDLSALFVKQAEATPDAPALEDENVKYTYAQLHAKVEDLADHLRNLGVGRDSLVGVLLARSADYVIACLAALRAGGAYLVLELAYPPGLLGDVIDDADPVAIITYRSEVGKIQRNLPLIVLDDNAAEINGHAKEPPPRPEDTDLERLSFVAYSSGTTGRPKGIANPHRASVLSYDLRFQIQDVKPGDRVACNVFFVWEMIRPLLRGATVVCVPDETSYDPVALVDLLSSKNITETLMTPTLLAAVLFRHVSLESLLPKLRTVWLNGEVVTTDLARRALKALPQVRLLNCYSACETHEIACGDIGKMLDLSQTYCPVGPPIEPDTTYILDEGGNRVETGVSGELCLGGKLLARGYLNRPETTAKAFVPNPFDSRQGSLMYRTGDLARLLPNGLLEITGRVGAMIKLRGYSVVPGKVQNSIVKHLSVRHCAVIAHGEGLNRQLVAYVVPDKEASADRPAVEIDDAAHSPQARKTLGPHLAQYMIPALWVELKQLPTNDVSGKVDVKKLPPPVPTKRPNVKQAQVQDSISVDDIAEIWAATLNISRTSITPEHSFFDLGGHSLSLADLASRLTKHFGFRVPVSRLADPITLNGHLETVRGVRDGHTAAVQADLPAVLRADAILDDDIQPPPNTKRCPIEKAETVLLTGVTGFLGAFLLNDILQATSANIICLVRFPDPLKDDMPAGIARLRRNLLEMGLWSDPIMERVTILPGNLSRKRFGLSPDAFDTLASKIQVIVHAAATVNLVYPYAALRAANVGGTREILRLASRSGATVNYVSTNGVLPPAPSRKGWSEDAMLDVEDVPTQLADGYGQTKWVAEKLVLAAADRGLPVRAMRVGTISGHSQTGAANAWDLLTAILVESTHLGYAPDVQGWRAEMTPVDFISKSFVHLANETKSERRIFHIGDPDPVEMRDVFNDLADLGYPTKRISWDEWVAMWNEKRGSTKGGDGGVTVDILRSGMPTVAFLRDIVVLDNAATRPLRLGIERPKVDRVLLETYARHWFARGWLPKAPTRHDAVGGSARAIRKGPLSGKVAVITGASSGIGAAVAAALAREGCHIALAARRYDALDSVKQRLTVREGKVFIHATDVTKRDQVEALIRETTDHLGPIDFFISCAGVMYYTMMANAHVDEWERTVDVNCKGLLNGLSAVVPGMLSRSTGHIIAISSDAGRKVFPGLGVYSASKFFVEAALQSLRLETVGSGLRITTVQPGNTQTDLLGMSTDKEAVKKYGEATGAQILKPDDVARSIVYALRQPPHVAVNEVLIEPRDEPI